MDSRLKQRLIGAAVLVALAVIFLPMLVQGPAPDSGVSDVPLSMPDAPRADYQTRDLPLVTPGNTPDGGAVGMTQAPASVTPPPAAASSAPAAAGGIASPAAIPVAPADAAAPAKADAVPTPSQDAPLPPVTAAGDYAVSVGTYATTAAADAIVASLRAARLPGYREAAVAGGQPAWRVRIGPYATRAQAEAARLHAAQLRESASARVVVLDAPTAPAKPVAKVAATSTSPASAPATPTVAANASPPPAATPAAAAVGFAVQLAAFSKPADATALRDKVRGAGFSAFTETVSTDRGTLTRVRAGPVQSRAEADQLQAQLKAKLGLDGVVRPHP
jgi:cell division septation protein DedD